jgi:alpha-tubulin suppressor-like RCC1 family protein
MVAAGDDHRIALSSAGAVWTRRDSGNGQLGDSGRTSGWTPRQVVGLSGVTAIAAGACVSSGTERIPYRDRAEAHSVAQVLTEKNIAVRSLRRRDDGGIPEAQRVRRHELEC